MGCFNHSFPSHAPVFICCAVIVLSPHGAMLPPAVQPAEDRWSVSYVTGDLFSCPGDEALAHCISEDCRMGAGIAVMFKKNFKGVEELKEQSESALLLKINQEWSVLFLGASISEGIILFCTEKRLEKYWMLFYTVSHIYSVSVDTEVGSSSHHMTIFWMHHFVHIYPKCIPPCLFSLVTEGSPLTF